MSLSRFTSRLLPRSAVALVALANAGLALAQAQTARVSRDFGLVLDN